MAEKHGEYEQGPGVEEMIALLKGIESVSGASSRIGVRGEHTEEEFLSIPVSDLKLDDHAWASVSHLIAGANGFAEIVAEAQRNQDLALLYGVTVNFAQYIVGNREVLESAMRIAGIRQSKDRLEQERKRTDTDNILDFEDDFEDDSEEEN